MHKLENRELFLYSLPFFPLFLLFLFLFPFLLFSYSKTGLRPAINMKILPTNANNIICGILRVIRFLPRRRMNLCACIALSIARAITFFVSLVVVLGGSVTVYYFFLASFERRRERHTTSSSSSSCYPSNSLPSVCWSLRWWKIR